MAKKIALVALAVLLIASVAIAQPNQMAVKGTPNLSAMKAIPSPAGRVSQAPTYQVPVTQELPLADGSGKATVVVQVLSVTRAQLTQGIAQSNAKIAADQAQVAKLQAQLDVINAKEAAAAPVVAK